MSSHSETKNMQSTDKLRQNPKMDKERFLRRLTPIIIGGAGFSHQLVPDSQLVPLVKILRHAFDSGIRAIDTSPYSDPSETIFGEALQHASITSRYHRSDYCILTKVGRITAKDWNCSPSTIRSSVKHSLTRFKTSYLDVVFVHDVELMPLEQAMRALAVLFELENSGVVRAVGISGYDIDILSQIAFQAIATFGRPVDVVQSWAQLNLQNTRLEQRGFSTFRDAGVKMVCCSSPLATDLLRSAHVSVGALGKWHPAPAALQAQARLAARWVNEQRDDLTLLALRYAIIRAQQNSSADLLVTTISDVSSLSDLQRNLASTLCALGISDLNGYPRENYPDRATGSCGLYNHEVQKQDVGACDMVRSILGEWIDFDFSTQKMARSVSLIKSPIKEILLSTKAT